MKLDLFELERIGKEALPKKKEYVLDGRIVTEVEHDPHKYFLFGQATEKYWQALINRVRDLEENVFPNTPPKEESMNSDWFDERGFTKVLIGRVDNGWIVWMDDEGSTLFKAKYSKIKVFESFDAVLSQINDWFDLDEKPSKGGEE